MSFLQFAGSLVNFGGTFVKGDVAPVIVLPPMTLRFKFSKAGYDPTVAGVGSAGIWRNVSTSPENIWDWTNTNPDWGSAFQGAFPDDDNEAYVIAAGDTSSVTNVYRMFAGIYSNLPQQASYSLTTRNNIVSCVPFDVSDAPISNMFTGSALKHFIEFSTSESAGGIFADTYIEEVGDVSFTCKSSAAMFARCSKLKSVGVLTFDSSVLTTCAAMFWSMGDLSVLEYIGGIEGTENCDSIMNLFANCHKLKHIWGEIDCSSMTNCTAMFNGCFELDEIPTLKNIGSTNISSVYAMFASCRAVKELPLFDTSHATDARNMLYQCYELEEIPDYDFSSVTNVNSFAKNSFKMKYGILEMYHKLLARGSAITNHTDCFKDCGRDTAEGRAALAQIPQDWGGTMEPPPEPPTENYFQITNRGSSAESLTITSGGNGTVFVDGAYAAQFSANSPTSVTVPSGSMVQIVGLVPRGTSWASGTLSSASGSSFSIDRFDESLENPSYLFCGWTGLTSVTSWTGASEYTGMTDTFADCSNLTTIPSSWNGLGNVTTMTDTFNETGLTAIPDSWAGLDNVTNMSNIFENCSGIVTGGSTGFSSLSKVTNADAAFSGCTSWTGDAYGIYEYLSGKQIAVTNHNNTFNGCIGSIGYSNIWETWGGGKSYNPLNLPSNTIRIQMVDSTVDPTSWEGTWSRVSGTTDTWDCTYPYWSYLFDGKSSIKRVLGANGTGVTGMAYMFRRCTSLESIVPFDTSSASSMVAMFNECSALTTVSAIDTSNATSLYQIFYKCSNLTTVPTINAHSATSTSYAFYNCSSLTSVQVTSTENVTNFDSMFRGCAALTAVPPIDTSHAANLDMFLSGCSSLDSVPIFDTSNATSVGSMLSGCSSLATVPLFDTGKATYMASMLSGCSSLTAVPLFDTSKATNVSGMLSGCRSLNAIPLFDTSNATNMSQFVSGCSSLISVPLFDTSNATNMFGMLSGCSSLTSIPLFDTSKATEVSAMLSGCSGLTTVPLLDISRATEAGSFLSGCSSLTVVPLFDTSNLVNMAGFMKDCTSITSLPLFDTGKAVYVHDAFNGCTNVETGALALYQQMSTQTTPPTSHDKAFFWCGISTVSGQAELNQIPQDWGGTMAA